MNCKFCIVPIVRGSNSGCNPSQFKKPSLRTATTSLYMQAPKVLEEATRPNLSKKLFDLLEDGEDITITDESLPISMNLTLKFA